MKSSVTYTYITKYVFVGFGLDIRQLSEIHIIAMHIWKRECRLPCLCYVYTPSMNEFYALVFKQSHA